MAVYTHLGARALAALIAEYDVGELISAKGIAEGVSNSNWLVETSGGRFILTVYEARTRIEDLPFFLGLLDHLAAAGCPVPRTIHDRSGAAFRMVGEKAAALIEFLPGLSVTTPTAAQAHSVGAALAGLHHAVRDFPRRGVQTMGLAEWVRLTGLCGRDQLAAIDPALPAVLEEELSYFAGAWPFGLPHGVVHCDLFPDNVLFTGDRVAGLIDFYFAAEDFLAYDLAVTHAAWCFDPGDDSFRPEISAALLAGYRSVRALLAVEVEALPVLARGACVRFITSRAHDWIFTPSDALVVRKDPRAFMRRLAFYREAGERLWA